MSNLYRITITEKGRDFRKILIPTVLPDSPTLSTTRQIVSAQSPLQPSSPSSPSYRCRTGYFRPKEATHTTLKTESSNRIYPNYMKRDPREYPARHQCEWKPAPTVNSSRVIQSVYPTTNSIHHTLYDSGNDMGSQTLAIKDLNSALTGQHGQLTMNVTACQYPGYKADLPEPSTKALGESTLGDSSTFGINSKVWSQGKRSYSQGTIVPLKDSLVNSTKPTFKLPFNKLENFSTINSEVKSHRLGTSSISQCVEEDTLMKAYVCKTHRQVTKRVTQEKVALAFRKYNQSQKDYVNLLDRLDKKMKDKLLTKLENPEYMPGFTKRLQDAATMLQKEKVKDERQTARYKERIRVLSRNKYEKVWEKFDDFQKKTTNKAYLDGSNIKVEDEADGRDSITRGSRETNQRVPTRRTARSTEMSQISKKGSDFDI